MEALDVFSCVKINQSYEPKNICIPAPKWPILCRVGR